MVFYTKHGCTIVRKHSIVLFFRKLKFIFFFALAAIVYGFAYFYSGSIEKDVMYFIVFPFIFILLNYAFVRLILSYIRYYNRLFIIYEDHIFITHSSLMMIDDFEVIDIHKVMKIDSFSRWLLSNMFWYWDILLEQQQDEIRTFHFMPDPYKIIETFQSHKSRF